MKQYHRKTLLATLLALLVAITLIINM